jgi:hypothetical protein
MLLPPSSSLQIGWILKGLRVMGALKPDEWHFMYLLIYLDNLMWTFNDEFAA